ncbi:sugar diacid recognition domain-containing protein [Solibacillus sp. CAU 1738]|uniref:CdaR family transcriptional regulator n=1 Tax=Solibacillus sp. CAU 1738 TaxID=3140363 RepID=UPI0032612967
MLTKILAETIVNETSKVLSLNVNIMDLEGIIIASKDPSRISQFHEGALMVQKTKTAIKIFKEDTQKYRGAQEGINIPIEFSNEIVGTIGITGDPNKIEEISNVVKMLAELLLKQAHLTSANEWKNIQQALIIEELLHPEINLINLKRLLFNLSIPIEENYLIVLIETTNQFEKNTRNHLYFTNDLITRTILHKKISINRYLLVFDLSKQSVETLLNLFTKFTNLFDELKIAYTTPINNITYLKSAYEECNLILNLNINQNIINYESHQLEGMLSQIPLNTIEKFLNNPDYQIIIKHKELLTIFIKSNLNVGIAAKELFIHPNTLKYRLNKIQKETNLDTRNIDDVIIIKIILLLNQFTS